MGGTTFPLWEHPLFGELRTTEHPYEPNCVKHTAKRHNNCVTYFSTLPKQLFGGTQFGLIFRSQHFVSDIHWTPHISWTFHVTFDTTHGFVNPHGYTGYWLQRAFIYNQPGCLSSHVIINDRHI